MKSLLLSKHKDYINDLVSYHIKATVEIIDDVEKHFAETENAGKQDTNRIFGTLGKALWKSPTKPDKILLQDAISTAEINDQLLAIVGRGFSDAYSIITTSRDFMNHLVLHEVAHIKNDWDPSYEKECDEWAFEQLRILKATK
jgi:hypothetical protein